MSPKPYEAIGGMENPRESIVESLKTAPRGDEDEEYLRMEAEMELKKKQIKESRDVVSGAYSPISKSNIRVWN